MRPSTVLVTGVSRFIGGHTAAQLAADPSIDRVLGVDTVAPGPALQRRLGRVEFVPADIRNPAIAKIISGANVDTVVHAALSATPNRPGSRSTMKEMNVIGTMQLLAACQRASSVSKLVVKSTAAVYGVGPREPAVFTEDHQSRVEPPLGYGRDALEIEGYIRGFARRRDDVTVTVLRFANIVGPRIDSVLTRFFSLPLVPTVLGYDARLQLLHERDALAVLQQATRETLPGVFNVAADGVMSLSQAVRRAGHMPVPIAGPAVMVVDALLRRSGLVDYSPEQVRFLNYGRVLDTARLRRRFDFEPKWTTAQAFDDFLRGHGVAPVIDPRHLGTIENKLLALVRELR